MRATLSYDYCILRVVPSVEREEFVNAGVVLHCPEQAFLDCRVHIDEPRWRTWWPSLDTETIRRHLEAYPRICAGDPDAGPLQSYRAVNASNGWRHRAAP